MLVPNAPMKEQAKEWFMNYCHVLEENNKQKEKIIDDTGYMNSLIESLGTNGELRTDKVDSTNCLSMNSLDSKRLLTLYSIVRDYANKNYIVSMLDEDGLSYFVSYGSMIVQVGFDSEKTKTFFARIVNKKSKDTVIIPFQKIKEDLIELKKQDLLELQNCIRTLKQHGISDEDIIYTTGKELKYVR